MRLTEAAIQEAVRDRIRIIREGGPDSIAAMMDFQLLGYDGEREEYLLRCKTLPCMRNMNGTLHGGLSATILDQAMGLLSHSVKPGEGIAPTVQLQVTYHRPLIPGVDVLVKVKVLSVTRSLIHITSEAYSLDATDKLCLSGSGVFFFKSRD